jgi:hypothetical protein
LLRTIVGGILLTAACDAFVEVTLADPPTVRLALFDHVPPGATWGIWTVPPPVMLAPKSLMVLFAEGMPPVDEVAVPLIVPLDGTPAGI